MKPDDGQLLADLSDRVFGRFYGKYRGTVTAVDDQTLRIKATVPAVLGTQPTGWAMPCVPYAGPSVGMAFLPEVESGVWIEFEGGDVSFPIWVGCYWRDGEIPSEATSTVKAIITCGKVKLLFDQSNAAVTLSDADDNKLSMTSSGTKLSRGQQSLEVSTASVTANDGALEVK
jgi:uncharacterized protein involved in type VI secretion and phage assembly